MRDPAPARDGGGREDGMAETPRVSRVDACVERILAWAGTDLRVAAPLGLGKPNVLLNALYRRAVAEPGLTLHLYTALSLTRPAAESDLERRFLGPFLERHFGAGYPDLDYAEARRAGRLPANVRISEFYFQSGAMLGNEDAQREYVSLNYTHAARDLAEMGINVITQLVARRDEPGRERWSLACNPDVTQDLLDVMAANGRPRPLVVGVVHPALPFVGNEAEVGEAFFDLLLDDPACAHTLFALTREPVEIVEFALGLQASTLVRDGGTLQIGIGALFDASIRSHVDYTAPARWSWTVSCTWPEPGCCGGTCTTTSRWSRPWRRASSRTPWTARPPSACTPAARWRRTSTSTSSCASSGSACCRPVRAWSKTRWCWWMAAAWTPICARPRPEPR